MKSIGNLVNYELYKIYSNKTWWNVFILIFFLQGIINLLEGKAIAQMGLTATPQTNPDLIEALPPVHYLGFDILAFGQVPVVCLGAILGATEYKNHELRTTFLCASQRVSLFVGKFLSITISAAFLSFFSIFFAISMTHIGLGAEGLSFFFLSSITWKFIGYATVNWLFLMLLSYTLAIIFHHTLLPLLFLLPQIMLLDVIFNQIGRWGRFLPVVAGEALIATPTKELEHNPLLGIMLLLLWLIILVLISAYSFIHNDVGGKY